MILESHRGYHNTVGVMSFYNHTTTNLVIHANERSQEKLSKAYNRQSIIAIQVHGKLKCSFTETMKVVANLFQKAYGEKLIY